MVQACVCVCVCVSVFVLMGCVGVSKCNACGHIYIYCIHVKSLFSLHVGDAFLVIASFFMN